MMRFAFDPVRRVGLLGDREPPMLLPRVPAAIRAEAPQTAFISGDLLVEIRPLSACHLIVSQWRTLATRAVEPNVFFGPDFLLGADQHLPEAAGCSAVLVWDRRRTNPDGTAALLGFWPFRRGKLAHGRMIRGLTSRFACSGAPLLDGSYAVEAACAMLTGLRFLLPTVSAVMFGQMTLDGACARSLRAAASISDLGTNELEVAHRACLWPETAAPEPHDSLPISAHQLAPSSGRSWRASRGGWPLWAM